MKNFAKIFLSVAVCMSLANAEKVQHVFETPKDTTPFNGVELDWGVDLTFTFQGLDQNYGAEIKDGLALPTADLDLEAKVMSGFNVKLETMLSSHHHHETFVKGGYATMDNLDFIYPGFAKGFMDNATISVGVNDINYGDYHFRRTDNADVMRNPFINNMGIEGYMQAGFLEVLYRMPSLNMFVLGGITNGEVNPDDIADGQGKDAYGFYGKAGWDSQISDSTRVRLTESLFMIEDTSKSRLYMGDKAGNVPRKIFGSDDFGAVWNAVSGYKDLTASNTNLFIDCDKTGTEFFGLFEYADGVNQSDEDFTMVHYSAEVVQRFAGDKLYAAARYENATVEREGDALDDELTQYQVGLGWFLSKNAMMKVEYINQERKNIASYGQDVKFDGYMVSAALSF